MFQSSKITGHHTTPRSYECQRRNIQVGASLVDGVKRAEGREIDVPSSQPATASISEAIARLYLYV